jgi:glycosyltransferase involved in cell wall biosynthesis
MIFDSWFSDEINILYRISINKMNICFYLSTPGGLTGAPRRIITLASAIPRYGVNAFIVADQHTELYQEATKLQINAVPLPTSSILKERNRQLLRGGFVRKAWISLNLFWHNIAFFYAVMRVKPDIVLFRASKTFVFAGLGALALRKPVVWDVDYETPSRGMIGRIQQFALRISSAAFMQYPGAEAKIFDESTISKHKDKFFALIPGIRLAALDGYLSARECCSRPSDRVLHVLHVGTICDRKNQLLALEALVILRRCFPEIWQASQVRISFAGGTHETEYKATLDAFIEENGLGDHVDFLGWQDNVPALMVDADVLFLPSKDEGVPNTVQEAMYIGCPVAVANTGGMPSIVSNGETGWVLPVDDPRPWADLLAQFLEGRAGQVTLAEAAQEFARRNFDDERWAASYADALRKVAAGV